MTGIDFSTFATLSVISLVVSVVFFYVLHYRLGPGLEGFITKIPVTWVGAWGGPALLGHWGVDVNNVHVIPALLCSSGTLFIVTRFWKTVHLVDAHDLLHQRDLQQARSKQRVQLEIEQNARRSTSQAAEPAMPIASNGRLEPDYR